MGMSAEEYWDGDPQWVKAYRKAEKIKTDKLNQQLWLQGMYVYDAVCKASPILHAFAKQGTKAMPYPDQPYALTKREDEQREEAQKKKKMLEAKKYMEQFALRYQAAQKEAGR